MNFQSNYLDFIKAVTDTAEYEVPRQALKFQKEIYYEALKRIVKRTPVKTGRARANWVVARSNFYAGQWFKKTDPQGDETIAKGWRVINKMKAYENCFINNNLPYIERLENGWSKQAPSGMVRITIQELAVEYGLEVEES